MKRGDGKEGWGEKKDGHGGKEMGMVGEEQIEMSGEERLFVGFYNCQLAFLN